MLASSQHCYDVHDAATGALGSHHLYLWDESVGGKGAPLLHEIPIRPASTSGANNVLSCVWDHLLTKGTGSSQLRWWSDNTTSQLKNFATLVRRFSTCAVPHQLCFPTGLLFGADSSRLADETF
jgi:hypothetical protein